jgi:hypothetical protein
MGCGCCDSKESEEPELLKAVPRKQSPLSNESGGIWNREWSSKTEEEDAVAITILRMIEGFADYCGVIR